MNSSKLNKVIIIGVPIDLGSKPLGVRMGPDAIRYAGLHEAMEFNKIEFLDIGDLEIQNRTGNESINEIARISEITCDIVADSINKGYIPIILGGDHSASIGSISGAAKETKDIGLLWLDCHPDANTPETSPSGNIHGMVVAVSLGFGPPNLVNCGNFSPKLKPENICIIGAKDIDIGEQNLIDKLGIKMFTLHDIEEFGIVEIFKNAKETVFKNCVKIHVSLDVDVLDPVIAPGTGIISRGGLSFREISFIMRSIGKDLNISSIDIIEINPLLDIRNQTSELAVELLSLSLGGVYGDYEKTYLK